MEEFGADVDLKIRECAHRNVGKTQDDEKCPDAWDYDGVELNSLDNLLR